MNPKQAGRGLLKAVCVCVCVSGQSRAVEVAYTGMKSAGPAAGQCMFTRLAAGPDEEHGFFFSVLLALLNKLLCFCRRGA